MELSLAGDRDYSDALPSDDVVSLWPRERYTRLEVFLDEYVDPLEYDVVLIDLPGLTNNVSYNGLWAARHVITPIEMGPFEAEQADALRRDLEKIADTFAVDIQLSLVLPNKVDTRTTLAEEYLEAFRVAYPEAIAPEIVPYSQDIRNATEAGHTAFALDSPSKTAQQAREAYCVAAKTSSGDLSRPPARRCEHD